MSTESKIVLQARKYAEEVLRTQLSPNIKYHSVEHTHAVVEAALEIAINSGITGPNLEIVALAAWFHDLGYREVIENHEDVSASIAFDFLSEYKYDDTKAASVAGCILATKVPQTPKNKLEAILCDADMIHLADENYFAKAELLREEIQETKGEYISERSWLEQSRRFIERHQFFTEYAREHYTLKERENLRKIDDKLLILKKQKARFYELKARAEGVRK